jgi:hypothetical protein
MHEKAQIRLEAAGELACRPGTDWPSSATSDGPPHCRSPARSNTGDSQ